MKKLFLHLTCLSLLVAMSVSCGKDENKSGATNRYLNPIVNPNIGQNGTQALQSLQSWYSSNTETQHIGRTGDFRRTSETVSTGGSGFFNFDFDFDFDFSWGGSGGLQPTHCFMGVGSATPYSVGTPNNGSCLNAVQLAKANNTKLRNAINGDNGTLTLINITRTGSVYTLLFGPQSQNTYYPAQPTVKHVIDTNMHSIFNPVETIDLRNGTIDRFEGYRTIIQ